MDVKRSSGLFIALVLLVTSPLATTGSAGATDTRAGPAYDLSAFNVPDEERHDLEVIAGQEEISVREAYRRYGWGQDFSDAVAAVAQEYPDDFVTSAMNQDGEVGGVGVLRRSSASVCTESL
jgi:hypothetical protein